MFYEKRGRKCMELTESVIYFLAKDSQPMYHVETPGFRTLIKSFDGRCRLPQVASTSQRQLFKFEF